MVGRDGSPSRSRDEAGPYYCLVVGAGPKPSVGNEAGKNRTEALGHDIAHTSSALGVVSPGCCWSHATSRTASESTAAPDSLGWQGLVSPAVRRRRSARAFRTVPRNEPSHTTGSGA